MAQMPGYKLLMVDVRAVIFLPCDAKKDKMIGTVEPQDAR